VTFFNKKEDVISIELTPYGRSLMSKGTLMPTYYAFFDDDILYDAEAGGFTEEQNVIQTRILTETPRLKPQRDLMSPEEQIFVYERDEKNTHPHTTTKLNYLTEPLGTSDQTSIYGPGWKSTFIQGDITGSVSTTLTGSSVYLRQIPQVNTTIEFTMQIKNNKNNPPVRGQKVSPRAPVSTVFSDGTYIDIIEKQILCHLTEQDSFILKGGLEIEAYLYDDIESGRLRPLKFLPRDLQIRDGILYEEKEGPNITIGPTYVEHYINFNTDGEIPDADICAGMQVLKSHDLELSLDVECPDREGIDFDIYGTRITDADLEDCEE
tara:strand:- start:4917 stop:5882 length:966 start_codon:yes stop_codon:yes gene_type:complete